MPAAIERSNGRMVSRGEFNAMSSTLLGFGLTTLFFSVAQAALELSSFKNDIDLTHFVSRPEIKVPILDAELLDETNALSGHWFLGPYSNLTQQPHPFAAYQACQIGPAIYDDRGELIWAGACDVRNHNTLDFRPFTFNGSEYLSFIKGAQFMNEQKGVGVVLDSSYNVVREVRPRPGVAILDIHEFRVFQEGDRMKALFIIQRPIFAGLTHLNHPRNAEGWLVDTGFTEIDMLSGETVFEWWPSEHVKPTESYYNRPDISSTNPNKPYNWFHTNSVDKNSNGDYLVSGRYTSTIYKISGKSSEIVWRLGGKKSDFQLNGFNFSYQHDARWISHDDDEEVISFLDNGADSEMIVNTTQTSSALIVALDKRTSTARVLERWWRPDGELSRLRGNFQTFSHSTNIVAGWSDHAYATEHDINGKLLAEMKFRSKRMVTYRAYKANFTGMPKSKPDAVGFAFGTSPRSSVTVVYMSWNGATQVSSWKIYHLDGDAMKLLGSAPKTGFETIFQVPSYCATVLVEAVGKDGRPLPFGRSKAVAVQSHIEPSQSAIMDEDIVAEPKLAVDGRDEL